MGFRLLKHACVLVILIAYPQYHITSYNSFVLYIFNGVLFLLFRSIAVPLIAVIWFVKVLQVVITLSR